MTWLLTSNKLFHLAVAFPIHQVRGRRMPCFVRVIEEIGLDVSVVLHILEGKV
jgi:hypothetical protein